MKLMSLSIFVVAGKGLFAQDVDEQTLDTES